MEDDRETKVPCPKCGGDGMVRTEDATTVRAVSCVVCDGEGLVSRERMRSWRLSQAMQPA